MELFRNAPKSAPACPALAPSMRPVKEITMYFMVHPATTP